MPSIGPFVILKESLITTPCGGSTAMLGTLANLFSEFLIQTLTGFLLVVGMTVVLFFEDLRTGLAIAVYTQSVETTDPARAPCLIYISSLR